LKKDNLAFSKVIFIVGCINLLVLQILTVQICKSRRFLYMKATGIVRRIDDLGRVVIPKEIRRTMRIKEGDPTLTSLTPVTRFLYAIMDISKRFGVDHEA
jgi:hypothetical protein